MEAAESSKTPRGLRIALILGLTVISARMGANASQPSATLEMRVATIGYRLATRSVAYCARRTPATGLLLHDIGAYDPAARAEIRSQLRLGDGMGVLGVVPNSVAERSGLRPGDEIVAVDGIANERLPLPPVTKSASYDRIEAFTAILASGLSTKPVMLTVRGPGPARDVMLPRLDGCAVRFAMMPSARPDAWSDGRYATVTRGLAEVASDDELAFALAHEMAHVLMGHAQESSGALAVLGLGGKRSRDRERSADELGVRLIMAAGYDPAGAPTLLRRLAQAGGDVISTTHPSIRARTVKIKAVAAGIAATAKPASR